MRKSLLEIVQFIMNDMDSDDVNSINDTVESQQVANIVRQCYEELITNRNWPHLKKLVQFEAANDITKPNYLKSPDGLKELITLLYDCRKTDAEGTKMRKLEYKDPEDFLRYVSQRTGDNVQEVTDFSGSVLLIVNNQAPQYWTTFDDEYIVTDSYDKSLDTTLKKSKSQALAYILPTWTHTDDAYPFLPDEAFPLLIEESKSTAFVALRQSANSKAEQKAARQNRWLARKAWKENGGIQYPDYGRKGRR